VATLLLPSSVVVSQLRDLKLVVLDPVDDAVLFRYPS
jgi:hypothetical protein